MICRLALLAMLALLIIVLRRMQLLPKCPCCFVRVAPEWRGQVGYCPHCWYAGWGAR
jgi:hypothetical protein